VQELLEVHKGLGEIGVRADFRFLDSVQEAEKLSLACGRGDVVFDVFVEDNEAGGVALLRGHVDETGRHVAREIEFVDGMRAIAHGGAGVEQDQQLGIRFAAIALQIHALAAGEDIPIDVAQIVTRRVGAVLGELLAETEIGGAVQAGDEAVHDGLGDEVESVDGGESGRI
jgi:hypothetical protein